LQANKQFERRRDRQPREDLRLTRSQLERYLQRYVERLRCQRQRTLDYTPAL